MKDALFSNNFDFKNIKLTKYHYTDGRNGAYMNYLAYMLKGHAKIVSNNNTIIVNEGDVFFIPENLQYQSYWYGDDEINFLSCGFHNLFTWEKSNFQLQNIFCSDDTKEKLLKIYQQGKDADCRALSWFYSAMADIIPNMKYAYESNEKLLTERIKKCIEENSYSSLSEIAKMCCISQPYMYALFKRNTSITPNDYKQKIQCQRGIELLLTTDKTIEEIATISNFSSASYFRKVLKKQTDSTPKEIRKRRGF